MSRPEHDIVGAAVPDQDELRPPMPTSDLDAFIEFLTQFEALFGPDELPREVTRGSRFLL